MSAVTAAGRIGTLQRRIRWIVAATIGYNLIEAVMAVVAGSAASSGALIGFGLDSTIEVLSAAAVAWQFTRREPERWERPTLRVIAIAFFALAVYVTAGSLVALLVRADIHHSPVGIVLTALSVVVMPFLSLAERRAEIERLIDEIGPLREPRETPEIEVILLENYRGASATDAYGVAEPSNIATAPAIANAVYNAIGVRLRSLPMTPAAVLAALHETPARGDRLARL